MRSKTKNTEDSNRRGCGGEEKRKGSGGEIEVTVGEQKEREKGNVREDERMDIMKYIFFM